MPPSYPDVNGMRTSYCSIELGIAGFQFVKGVKGINYEDEGEIPEIPGAAAVTIGRTRGGNKCKGDIELYQEEWDDLLPVLTFNGVMGYMESAWPITVTYAEPVQFQKTKTDTLYGVRFHSAARSNSEGSDALTVKLQMSIMRIMWHSRYVAMRLNR
jgi:hypothetical protein